MKRTLTLVALGTAFVAVSLWVWLSRGKNAKAVRAKFRLGGAIIALTSLVNLTSCGPDGPIGVDCYDPAPVNEIYWDNAHYNNGAIEVKNGDVLNFYYYNIQAQQVAITIESKEDGSELQRTTHTITDTSASLTHTINVGDYTGEAILKFLLLNDNAEPYEHYNSYRITITAE